MGSLAILGRTGDVKVEWDADVDDEVSIAKKAFQENKKKGYSAFRVHGKDWRKGEQLKEFDPDAERIVMIPAMQGG